MCGESLRLPSAFLSTMLCRTVAIAHGTYVCLPSHFAQEFPGAPENPDLSGFFTGNRKWLPMIPILSVQWIAAGPSLACNALQPALLEPSLCGLCVLSICFSLIALFTYMLSSSHLMSRPIWVLNGTHTEGSWPDLKVWRSPLRFKEWNSLYKSEYCFTAKRASRKGQKHARKL